MNKYPRQFCSPRTVTGNSYIPPFVLFDRVRFQQCDTKELNLFSRLVGVRNDLLLKKYLALQQTFPNMTINVSSRLLLNKDKQTLFFTALVKLYITGFRCGRYFVNILEATDPNKLCQYTEFLNTGAGVGLGMEEAEATTAATPNSSTTSRSLNENIRPR